MIHTFLLFMEVQDFYISNDYLGGIVNELRSGLSYTYFLQAGKDLYINAGLSASFFHRGFNYQ